MRPRFANRGSARLIALNEAIPATSMRPRFANRGSGDTYTYRTGLELTSMRPRFANRGSHAGPPFSAFSLCDFNEAPIRESGKCVQ